jgi:hypothetical protein
MGPLTSYDTPLHHSPLTWAILNPLSPHYWVTREDPYVAVHSCSSAVLLGAADAVANRTLSLARSISIIASDDPLTDPATSRKPYQN